MEFGHKQSEYAIIHVNTHTHTPNLTSVTCT